MKYALAIMLTLLSAAALAASPEEDYITTRDALIARFNPPGDPVAPSDAVSKDEERARAELGRRLLGLIRPPNIKGYAGEGAYNVGSLFRGDIEFGTLDGLRFTKQKEMQLVVTTVGLLDRWVKSREGLAAEDGAAPPETHAALKLDLFYTRAINSDAAVSNLGELAVSKPAGVEFVFAMLAARRQDLGPVAPGEILVGLIAPPRVYVLSAPVSLKLRMMPACEKLWKDAVARSERMLETAREPDGKDERQPDPMERIREQGDEAMRKCFAQRARSDPAFSQLTKQAQELVNGLAGR